MTASVNQSVVSQTGSVALTGVISGDPLIVQCFFDYPPSDDFATPYTWVNLVNESLLRVWLGTGGSGTSGTVTMSGAPNGTTVAAIELAGTVAGSGTAILDTYVAGTSATPSAADDLMILLLGAQYGVTAVSISTPTEVLYATDYVSGYASFIAWASSSPLPPGTPVTVTYDGLGGIVSTLFAFVLSGLVSSPIVLIL